MPGAEKATARMFRTTKTASARDATPPVAGAVRSGAGVALAAYVVTQVTERLSGDAQLAGLTRDAVVENLPLILGVVMGLFTGIRKWLQEAAS